MTNVLTTTETQPATLTTEDGNPFNVTPVPQSGGGGGPLYSVVLRPGGVAGPNVFTSWASLYAATSAIAGGVRVTVDDSIAAAHMTAGTYSLDGWELVNGAGSATLIIDDGAHATWRNLFIDALNIQYNGTAAPFFENVGGANLYILDGSAVATAGQPLLKAGPSGNLAFVTVYPTCVIGDGTNLVFTQDPAGSLEVFQSGGQYAAAAQDSGTLTIDDSVSIVLPYAGPTLFLESAAPLVTYAPTNPGQWPTVPTTVQGGLDTLAGELLPSTGGFSIPIVGSGTTITVPITNAIAAPNKHSVYQLLGCVAVTTSVAGTVQAQVQRNGGASVGPTIWVHSDGTNRVSIPIATVDDGVTAGDFPLTYDLLITAGGVTTVQAPAGSGSQVNYVEL